MRGVHTALVTPFGRDGEVDFAAYQRLCERQISGGIHGLVPCGTTGETPTLRDEEWAECIRIAVRVADGRVPVTAGVGTSNTTTTLEYVAQARELGADAGLLVFSSYNKPNASGHRAHVKAAASKQLPLVLYHVPGRTGQRLDAALVAELTSMPGVIGLKEATGDVRYGGDVIHNTDTAVLSGDDFSFLSLLGLGGRGVISVVSNVAPAQTVAIYDHFVAGRNAEAAQGLMKLWPLITYLFSECNPVSCKAVMAALNLCEPDCRLPLGPAENPVPSGLVESLGSV